ncbi:hypothetical protein ACFZAM_13015 [Streptomyces sp. NPDC008079]|uniref:hypothetical protein n=1 Tax=Streptomyces sp. NPDC008079 TaxID=3364806 RepID=UPI0036E48362
MHDDAQQAGAVVVGALTPGTSCTVSVAAVTGTGVGLAATATGRTPSASGR